MSSLLISLSDSRNSSELSTDISENDQSLENGREYYKIEKLKEKVEKLERKITKKQEVILELSDRINRELVISSDLTLEVVRLRNLVPPHQGNPLGENRCIQWLRENELLVHGTNGLLAAGLCVMCPAYGIPIVLLSGSVSFFIRFLVK